jgi:DNA-directed RNA polymerase subunit beta'
MHDCGTDRGVMRTPIDSVGRVSCERIEDPTGAVVVSVGGVVTAESAATLGELKVTSLRVRSPMTCRAPHGVCQHCYGVDLATGELVREGTAVGIIAAQSVGEPGTQLTMRTFHLGGALSKEDITRGLPRVEQLFDAQRPASAAVLAEVNGVIVSAPEEGIGTVVLHPLNREGNRVGRQRSQAVPEGRRVLVRCGDRVERGQPMTDGLIDPHELLRLCGVSAVQEYLVREVQAVYRDQNVKIDDRHVEVLVAQMLRKVSVVSAGDTSLVPGSLIDRHHFDAANARLPAGKALATCRTELIGVKKAALLSGSFLSAASFEETSKVLTEAALAGKVDPLTGLKENVIVGKLVPAGTGFRSERG